MLLIAGVGLLRPAEMLVLLLLLHRRVTKAQELGKDEIMSTENETPTTSSSVPPPPYTAPVSPAAYDTPSPDAAYAYAQGPNPADVEKNKIFAILSYIGILFVVPLLAAKDSPFAMYHANQGLILFLLSVALGVVSSIVWVVAIVAWAVPLVFMILGIINAANGQMKPLPLIGGITILK